MAGIRSSASLPRSFDSLYDETQRSSIVHTETIVLKHKHHVFRSYLIPFPHLLPFYYLINCR
ncbi:hypothetical protein BV22DRAFT_1095172 [Leucogyrophana mollusca]|uniref:Uncharacterized protein n=1 Tax=Leucogyrophana mollusca TaxID=85980 RepID=A0ACB8B961_9AGAM|nr:hypothetical protein BV22DRAFT_1095172 [Leucogyrophana mollusca]